MVLAVHNLSVRARVTLLVAVLGVLVFFLAWFQEVSLVQWGTGKVRMMAGAGEMQQQQQSGRRVPAKVAQALIFYAKSTTMPQQSLEEINITETVLRARAPCNFLVFGLGYDSLMWKSLNYGGRTVFLEETASWVQEMQAKHPGLEAYHMDYTTQLQWQAELLQHSRETRAEECRPVQDIRTSKCRLAITNLPPGFYDVDWDVVMIDAPRGYFPEAPGRMAAIFTMSVLAKQRTCIAGGNYTDVMLHDVNRPVESSFAKEFLCDANRVGGVHRLWHFHIYPSRAQSFCPA